MSVTPNNIVAYNSVDELDPAMRTTWASLSGGVEAAPSI